MTRRGDATTRGGGEVTETERGKGRGRRRRWRGREWAVAWRRRGEGDGRWLVWGSGVAGGFAGGVAGLGVGVGVAQVVAVAARGVGGGWCARWGGCWGLGVGGCALEMMFPWEFGFFVYICLAFDFSAPCVDDTRTTRSRKPDVVQQPENQLRAKWTAPLTKTLADLMVDQIQKGNRSNKSFSKKGWKFICDNFRIQTGYWWDNDQLKSRYVALRKQYINVSLLVDHPDFKWMRQLVQSQLRRKHGTDTSRIILMLRLEEYGMSNFQPAADDICRSRAIPETEWINQGE
ncbi:hypothetical protein Sango_1858500 [Sesamum angolense]|uniref:Myb/SANT-like domain-containing protein n=1 Tax=Sesamum angolense TaxID=2727404 RepID=A0AAE1WI96_9LAMI|nr:hypothetical protein Sango_1858500 [Sesamum angolense]